MFRVRNLFALLLTAVVVTVFVAPPAEAKRLGGGMNFGKSYKYARPVQKSAPPAAPTRNVAQNKATASKNSAAPSGRTNNRGGGLMGMIGGLAAGGLLAALFFGGAFENINFFDILLLGGLALGGFALFRALRRQAARAEAAKYVTTGPGNYPAPPSEEELGPKFAIPEIGQKLEGEKLSTHPEWFNENAFVAEAMKHFKVLQKAWDSGDLAVIEEYTTPEFFEALKAERAKLPGQTETQIMGLRAELLDLLRDGDKVVAAILFHGYEQEGRRMPEMFSDVWHVEHSADGPEGDWRLAGIRKIEIPSL